jgi:hypothetical protein
MSIQAVLLALQLLQSILGRGFKSSSFSTTIWNMMELYDYYMDYYMGYFGMTPDVK